MVFIFFLNLNDCEKNQQMTKTSMQRVMGGKKRVINHFMGSVGTVPKSRVLYYITIPPFSFLVMAELMTGNSFYFLVNFPSYMLISIFSIFSIPQSSAIKCSEACLRKGNQTSHIPLKYNVCDTSLPPCLVQITQITDHNSSTAQ